MKVYFNSAFVSRLFLHYIQHKNNVRRFNYGVFQMSGIMVSLSYIIIPQMSSRFSGATRQETQSASTLWML